jgi:hypothetical protein
MRRTEIPGPGVSAKCWKQTQTRPFEIELNDSMHALELRHRYMRSRAPSGS